MKSKIGFMINSYSVDLTRTFSIYTDKLIIFPIFGFALLGNYQLGIQYLTILSILPNVVFQYVLPHDSSGNPNRKLKIVTILTSFILAIISIGIIPILLPIFLPKFEIAIPLVQIISIAIIPRTISMMYVSKFLGTERSKIVVVGVGIYLSTQIVGIIVLGELYGMIGVAWSLVIAAAIESIYFIVTTRIISKSKG